MPRCDLDTDIVIPASRRGEPAWALAALFPAQGEWSEEDYFRLETDQFVELVDGCIEVLPRPTWLHQRIVRWLFQRFNEWCVRNQRGEVLFAPLPLQLFPRTIREPDILIVERVQSSAGLAKYPGSAILVAEVVSDGNEARRRDLIGKRQDYARAGIPEYWIVDPFDKMLTVLTLDGSDYLEHGRFASGRTATSILLLSSQLRLQSIDKFLVPASSRRVIGRL